MAGQTPRGVVGILVHTGVNPRRVPPPALQAARRNAIDLQAVTVERAALDRLIPPVIRAAATTWLVLHGEQDDTNVLAVPYPAELADDPEAAAGNSPFSLLLETIRGDRNEGWFAVTGQRNLATAARHGRLPDQVRVFQTIQLPTGLWEAMRVVKPVSKEIQSSLVPPEIVQGIRQLVQKITGYRAALRDAIAADPAGQAIEAREVYDDQLLAHAAQLARTIGQDSHLGKPQDLSFLPAPIPDLLDSDSRGFLETSLIVEAAAVQSAYEDFDYAAAACPLWKMIERELNLSIGWLIRLLRGVAARESPWRARAELAPSESVLVPTGPEPGQQVELNERNALDPSLLKGLMLGPIRFLLDYGGENGLRGEILDQPIGGEWTRESLDEFLFGNRRNSASKAVARLIGLRNEHAHVKAMNRREFDSIRKTVLGRLKDARGSLLARVVALKAAIQAFVEGLGSDGPTRIPAHRVTGSTTKARN